MNEDLELEQSLNEPILENKMLPNTYEETASKPLPPIKKPMELPKEIKSK